MQVPFFLFLLQEDKEEALNRKKKLCYEIGADVVIQCADGSIKVNKTLLAEKSEVFVKMLFEYSSGESDVPISFPDDDLKTFKIFLDCIFGFKEYSPEIALVIFPIAHKYQVRKCLEKCIQVLSPTKFDENTCLALNLSLFYECEILTDRILKFILDTEGVRHILYRDEFSDLLEPLAVSKLLDHIKLDDRDINRLCLWGEKYLIKNNEPMSLKSFLTEYQILNKFSLECFSTIEGVFEFIETDKRREFFSDKEIFSFLRTRMLQKVDNQWVEVQGGEVLTECFVFNPPIPIIKSFIQNLDICRNQVIFSELKPVTKEQISYCVDITHKYYDRTSMREQMLSYRHFEKVNTELKCFLEHPLLGGDQMFCRLPIDPFNLIPNIKLGIKKVRISYTFKDDCRILKTFSKNLVSDKAESENRFFTHDIRPYFDLE